MDKSSTILYPNQVQSGIIDLFKKYSVYQNNSLNYKRKGEVHHRLDEETGKRIISIEGNLSAGNYIEIPNSELSKSINVTGRYFYIHIYPHEDKKFSIQLTFTLNRIPVKFNFKYPLLEMKFTQTNAYNIDIPLDFNRGFSYLGITDPQSNSKSCFGEWNIIKFSPADFINDFCSNEFKTFGSISSNNLLLKSFTASSYIKIQGVFISNSDFTSSLPKELSFTKINKNNLIPKSNLFDLNYIFKVSNNIVEPQEPVLIQDIPNFDLQELKNKTTKIFSDNQSFLKQNLLKDHDQEIDDLHKKLDKTREEDRNQQSNIADRVKEISNNSMNKSMSRKQSTTKRDKDDLTQVQNEELKKLALQTNELTLDKTTAVKNIFKKQEERRIGMTPDPIMSLQFLLGYSGTNSGVVKYSGGETCDNILFPSGSMMVSFNKNSLKQRLFLGHSNPITSCCFSPNSEIMFTAQEGKNAIIRIWKVESSRCVSIFTTVYEKVLSMSVSKNNDILVTVGIEGYNKEFVILWDIKILEKVKVVIRQASHFNILAIKFSPFEQTILSSCGKENIKFWRIKNDHLVGKAVVLNNFARNSVFSCIDYDNPFIGEVISKGRLFVGNNQGCIFQVSCSTMELDAVYKINDSSILSLAVNDAFCVTGSEDGYLRVWPVDFSEFLIEAKHDSAVVSVDISYNALEIICGMRNGSIGSLNIDTKIYKTILRSPPGKVYSMAAHPLGTYLYTVEENASVRIWDVEKKNEVFHFSSPRDPPVYVCSPRSSQKLVCGFESGTIKIFDIESTKVVYECRAFSSGISKLAYLQNDTILVSLSSIGHISLHDSSERGEYIQIKTIKIDSPAVYSDLTVSGEGDIFGTIGSESTSVIVWNTTSYGIRNRIPVYNGLVKNVCLLTNKLISVILEKGEVKVFSLVAFEGILVKEYNYLHSGGINSFVLSKNLKFLITGGNEGIIKVTDSKTIYKNYNSYQQFIGHSTGIKSLVVLEHKGLVVSVSERDGIFFWNFHGDLTFSETEIINELENLAIYNNQSKKFKQAVGLNTSQLDKQNNRIKSHLETIYSSSQQERTDSDTGAQTETRKLIKSNINTKINKTAVNFLMLPIEYDDHLNNLSYTKGSFTPTGIDNNSTLININLETKEDFLNKLFYIESFKPDHYKIEDNKSSSDQIIKRFIIGNSLNTRRNLIYNPYKRYFIYTINNKVIIEFLEEHRVQIILEEALDEISCITLSNDFKLLAAGTGNINKDTIAGIFIWELDNFTFIRRLNFHFKGIQDLTFSKCGQYLISIGSYNEKSICIWNLNNYTVVDSKSSKYSIFQVKTERLVKIEEYLSKVDKSTNVGFTKTSPPSNTYLVTGSMEGLGFWRYDVGGKIENYFLLLEDLTKDKSEFITSFELTPYFDKIKTSFVIIGTNKGNCLLIEKEKKNLIRKYSISQSAIMSIDFKLNRLIVTSDGPVIYSWTIPYSLIDEKNAFDFMKNTQAGCDVLLLDSQIRVCDFTADGKEGLVSTRKGSIYYVDIENSNSLKIVSCHMNEKINYISGGDERHLLTSGNDSCLKGWDYLCFDEKFEFYYYDQRQIPQKIERITDENIILVLFSEKTDKEEPSPTTFIRVYDILNLKPLGKITIPEYNVNISSFKVIFNGKGIVASTYQNKIYVLTIENWNPLSLLYTELDNENIPEKQILKHVHGKDKSNYSTIVSFSFSNGQVNIFKIDKNNEKSNVDSILYDSFNIFDYHIQRSDDIKTHEIYKNLTKFQSDYLIETRFSECWDEVVFCYHEMLQFLFIRNIESKELFRRIPLNYFPLCLSISNDEKCFVFGTREGQVLFITRNEDHVNTGFTLDIYSGQYSSITSIEYCSNRNENMIISGSHSEMIVWERKI